MDANIPEAHDFIDIIQFLRQSRIYYTISAEMPIYFPLINQFWMTAAYQSTPPRISATVENHQITITEESILEVLQFGDALEDPTLYHLYLLRGCFQRMGYRGSFDDTQLRKTNLSLQWRFFMHMLILCYLHVKEDLTVLGNRYSLPWSF